MTDPASYLYSITQFKNKDVGYGRRRNYGYASASASPLTYVFDLGSGFANKTASANYFALTRADLMVSGSVTQVRLLRSTDNVTYTAERTLSSFGSISLTGPRTKDYFETFTVTSSYRYWKVEITGPTSTYCGKFYFGNYWAPSFEPDYSFNKFPTIQSIEASDGSTWFERFQYETYEFELIWPLLTETDIRSFSSKILSQAHVSDMCLMTTSQHDILDNLTFCQCELLDHKINKRSSDKYSLETRWREARG